MSGQELIMMKMTWTPTQQYAKREYRTLGYIGTGQEHRRRRTQYQVAQFDPTLHYISQLCGETS